MNDVDSNARAIFFEALDRESPDEIHAYLEEACGADVGLRQRVEELLRAHDDAGNFLGGAVPANDMTEQSPLAEGPGLEIGPYKLLEQIGEGGFGVVFLAGQERPVRRRVALKIIKPGMDTRQVIARFEAERQALAMMDHPNIAKVYDAGTSESSRPYFVMELVQGVPITEYCDQCNLSTHERLELFVTVCQAVQHAHQKGVIHRDIKPTNILVAIQDGRAAPKIIDFGVAKAIDQQLTEQTLTVAYAQMVGTPLYMSPEQAELSPLGVDTRTDIYSLGVLLYELLTGTTPFDKQRLHAANYDEMRKIIREEEPPRPSARISTLAVDLATTIATQRRTDARHLREAVFGELDWIVMKCLEKDRSRRYETPSSLARDIERHLHDEPVQACPPSVGYRFRKFARRNKLLLAAGSAIAASLLIGLGLATWMYYRATTESARATTVSDLLQEMLSSADAANSKGADYKVRELLDEFSTNLGSQLSNQPEVEADIRLTIGRAYRSLKLPEKAQPHFEKAVELRRQINGPQSEELAAVLVDGGWNLLDQQRRDEAEAQLNEALSIYRQCGAAGAPLFHALEILQHVLKGTTDRDADTERVTQEALAVARQCDVELPDQANLLHRYADLKIRQGHFPEAEQIARQSVEMHHRLHGDRHPETAFGLKVLANSLLKQQKLEDAEDAVREALTIFRQLFPEDHPNNRDTMEQLRNILAARGDQPALEQLEKELDEIAMRSGSPDYRVRLGELLASPSITAATSLDIERLQKAAAARNEEAHRQIRQAMETYGRVATEYPEDLDRRADALEGYVVAIRHCVASPDFAGEVDELNRRLAEELPKLLAAFPDSGECGWRTAMIYRGWSYELSSYWKYIATTEHILSEAVEVLEKLSESEPKWPKVWWYLEDTYFGLGETQWRMGKRRDAEAAFRRGIENDHQHAAEIAAETVPKMSYWVALNAMRSAYHLACMHHEEEAVEFLRQAKFNLKGVADPVDSATAHWQLAGVQVWMGDLAGYRETCQTLVDLPADRLDYLSKLRRLFACTYAPRAIEDPGLLLQRAEEDPANGPPELRCGELLAFGAVHYRAADYVRAEGELVESLAANPRNPGPGFDLRNPQHLFLAMTKWQLGQQDEARRLLAETLPEVDKALHSPETNWIVRAPLEVIAREAEDLIEPQATAEAVEKENRVTDEPNQ